MNAVLSMRLKRLEKHTNAGNPYAHLSDEQLWSRLEEVDARIEAVTGMSVQAYAGMLEAGLSLPDGMSEADATAFIATLPKVEAMRISYGR